MIKAHAWYPSNGWAEYPFVRIGTKDDNIYPFALKPPKSCIVCEGDSYNCRFQNTNGVKNEIQTHLVIPPALTEIPIAIDLVGREEIVSIIKDKLDKHSVVYIHADGGVGKTAIAIAICNLYKNSIGDQQSRFNHVAWITSTGDLEKDLTSLCTQYLSKTGDAEKKYKDIRQWLSIPENATFLVIDNMDRIPSAEERRVLNTLSGSTKVLITSRAVIGDFCRVDLDELDDDSAVHLLYRHFLGENKQLSLEEIKTRSDFCIVKDMVKSASNNALMIELLGKAAYSECRELPDYWALVEKSVFNRDSQISLRNPHAESHGLDPEADDSLTMLEQIKRLYAFSSLSNEQRALMAFIATFPAGTKIYLRVIDWCGFDIKDLNNLIQTGWIKKEEDNYCIHPMVKGSIELQEKEADGYYGDIYYPMLIKELFSNDEYIPRDIPYTKVRERIVVPIVFCNIFIEKRILPFYIINLSHMISYVLRERLGDYDEALKYANVELRTIQEMFRGDNMFTSRAFNNIAQIYDDQKNYNQAIKYYNKDLEIAEKELGSDDPELAMRYNNLGWVYTQIDEYDKALHFFTRAYDILKNASQEHSLHAAVLFDNMAIMYARQGKYQKALQLQDNALGIIIRELGAGDLEVATVYNNIGVTYYEMGKYSDAAEFAKKSYSIRKTKLGENHPITIDTDRFLRNIERQEKNDTDEESVYSHSSDFFRDSFQGTKHLPLFDNTMNEMNISGGSLGNLDCVNKTHIRRHKKIGRNDLCPCGSGKKFKKCCMGMGKYD